jgi:hypothetical protein
VKYLGMDPKQEKKSVKKSTYAKTSTWGKKRVIRS